MLNPRHPAPALSMPPLAHRDGVLAAIDFTIAQDDPSQGEYTGTL